VLGWYFEGLLLLLLLASWLLNHTGVLGLVALVGTEHCFAFGCLKFKVTFLIFVTHEI